MNFSKESREERKREASPSAPSQMSKKACFREIGPNQRKVNTGILDSSDEEDFHGSMLNFEDYNLGDDDEDDEDDINVMHSLSGKPACRSILNELLSSIHQDEHSVDKRRKSITSSALGIQGAIVEEDEDDEDEKTTLPIARSMDRPPADEVDVFFTGPLNAERLERDKLRQHSLMKTLPYITNWPNFITLDFFERFSPKDRVIERDENAKISTAGFFDTDFSKGYKMGIGEHADVYYTCEVDTGEICATKKTKLPFTSWDDRWMKLIEVKHLLKVRGSAHCVKIKQAWEEQGYLHIQTELCTSGSLDEYLDHTNRKIPENIIWKIFYETVIGINDIHKQNIAHLDLKPSNILIDNYGFIKIADFGMSVETPAEMRWVRGEGDRRYMAPELLREQYNKSADIYSFGLLLLEMATGIYLPDSGERWEDIRFGDFSHQAKALSELSPELSNLIQILLTPNPLDRPTVDEIMMFPEFLKIQEIQQDENEKSSLFDYVREKEKAAAEAAKAREHYDMYSTPESRVFGCPSEPPM